MMSRIFSMVPVAAVGLIGLGAAIAIVDARNPPDWHTAPNSGGAATRASTSRDAFALPPDGLDGAQRARFFAGQRLFNIVFVAAPSRVGALDGRGPVFNRPSCARCHERNGRGRPPAAETEPMLSMVVRLSVPGRGPHGDPLPDPRYGLQLNDRAIEGVPPEGRARIRWIETTGRYGDGSTFRLRRPEIRFTGLAFGPLDGVLVSARIAAPIYGAGLLAAIPEENILAAADPDDRDGDGISGRVNRVRDDVRGVTSPGRFGWKAGQPTLRQQIADALLEDMGMTSGLYPEENCMPVQSACRASPHGGKPEITDEQLDALVFYVSSLAVPARRRTDGPEIRRGAALFESIGCAACHSPVQRTGHDAGLPVLSDQVIHPYTDLLLHDMGEGLADGRQEYEASGREWRTPPLWGIGLARRVQGYAFYLHDGRARTLAEAILWHGGEAEPAREHFRMLSPNEREALIAFLRSL